MNDILVKEGSGRGYKRAKRGTLVVMNVFGTVTNQSKSVFRL